MTFPYTIDILYEDDELLIIDKPSGLVVHPDGRTQEDTLVDWLVENYPHVQKIVDIYTPPATNSSPTQAYNQQPKYGIVHRLDRETSGVLVVAKTQKSFEHLKKQFQNRSVEKIYNAFVYGNLKDDHAVIDRPIGKSKKDFRLWSAQRGSRGTQRDAITEYSVIKRLPLQDMAFVEIQPKTGRTHQIRVHFKAIHHPVVCDKLYAPKHDCLGFSRLALHARCIAFENVSGERVRVEAPLPEEFITVF